MKKALFIFSVMSILTISAIPIGQIPQKRITNGLIHARLYLPDPKEGYYRGSRFDWSGVIASLEYQGHNYFGQWFEKYSPTLHDAITGPVDDFLPIGYEGAKPGETFLKIGIGILSKPAEPRYSIATPYPILNPGQWKVKTKVNQVEFVHKLSDKDYAYEYKKKIQLIKGKPEMVLSHSLKNTGQRTIETSVYNHNFFVIDSQPTGPGFEVKLPFNLAADTSQLNTLGKIQGNRILFLRDLSRNEHVYYGALRGFSAQAKDYDIAVENHKTGAAVRITSDRPLSKLVFWSAEKTLCPEPYIQVKVNPGEVFDWKISYTFYTCDIIQ